MKINERVENILKVSRSARNSDKALLLIYMERSGIILTAEQKEIFNKLPAFETITRIRRILQEQGKYEPDHHVLEARYEKYKTVKEGIHYEDPEKLLESKGYRVLPFGE
jgi:hypothetical protein